MSSSIVEVLTIARARGFLGPGDVMFHVEHARAFLRWVTADQRVMDLGSGGGLPGLILAAEGPEIRLTLLDASHRRTEFLAEAVEMLGLIAGGADGVEIVCARAEEVAREPDRRAAYDVVVTRSFGRPSVTAECAAPLLRVGGRLVVSDRDGGEDRWPADGLRELGLAPASRSRSDTARLQVLEQVATCPDRFPRRTGVPAKRPLF